MAELTITTLAERPELIARVYEIHDTWPAFTSGDAMVGALLHRVAEDFPEYCVIATDADGHPVARGFSVPFRFGGPHRDELPDSGWDRVLTWAYDDRRSGARPTMASALEITIAKDHLGGGLSSRMLAAMRDAVVKQGLRTLVAPVRPNEKHRSPEMPMSEYVGLTRPDGLPQDAWLRVHVRAGAEIVKVAPASMVVAASLAQWRAWTGLPFDADGEVIVPDALVPVLCSATHDRAVYVEPNVWVRHTLGSPGSG